MISRVLIIRSGRLLVAAIAMVMLWTGSGFCLDPYGLADTYRYPARTPAEAIEQDFPGATDSWLPVVFPPVFQAELRARPLFLVLTKGEFIWEERGIDLDLQDNLGFVDQVVFIETIARMQLARFSARFHFESQLRTLRGDSGNLTLPDYRIGADIDLLSSPQLRLGINFDFNWQRPEFSATIPNAPQVRIVYPRPVTAGFHFHWSPTNIWSISPTVWMMYRHPIRSADLKEFDVAAGIRLPETVFSNSAVRAGWNFREYSHESGGQEIIARFSGFYGEYVYFF